MARQNVVRQVRPLDLEEGLAEAQSPDDDLNADADEVKRLSGLVSELLHLCGSTSELAGNLKTIAHLQELALEEHGDPGMLTSAAYVVCDYLHSIAGRLNELEKTAYRMCRPSTAAPGT